METEETKGCRSAVPLDRKVRSDFVIEGCVLCHEEGKTNLLYWTGKQLLCPMHGEVSPERKAEYQKAGALFLWGLPPEQKQSEQSNGDKA